MPGSARASCLKMRPKPFHYFNIKQADTLEYVTCHDIPNMEEGAACAHVTTTALADQETVSTSQMGCCTRARTRRSCPAACRLTSCHTCCPCTPTWRLLTSVSVIPGSGDHSLGMLLQRGDGEYIPNVLLPKGQIKVQLLSGLKIEFVQYLPSMHAYMEAADLIISHAGSGSLFEALSLGRVIIAVPNAILMANHQVTFQPAFSSFYAIYHDGLKIDPVQYLLSCLPTWGLLTSSSSAMLALGESLRPLAWAKSLLQCQWPITTANHQVTFQRACILFNWWCLT